MNPSLRLNAQWSVRISDLITFLASHAGVYPARKSHNASEARLAGWVYGQKVSHKNGTLLPSRARRLETLPGWTWGRRTRSRRVVPWGHRLSDLDDFLSAHAGRYPSDASRSTTERQLADWVDRQKSLHNRGALSKWRSLRLKALPGWTWTRLPDARSVRSSAADREAATERRLARSGALWVARLAALDGLLSAHDGCYPSASSPVPAERALAGWVYTQKTSHKAGTLPPERARLLEALPGWTWERWTDPKSRPPRAASVWPRHLSEIVAFLSAHDGLYPSEKSPSSAERRLARWVYRQGASYESGTLPPERARLLEALPGWTVPRQRAAWPVRISILATYVARWGNYPSKGASARSICGLARWVDSQKVSHGRGTLPPAQVRCLEALPGWSWGHQCVGQSGSGTPAAKRSTP
ncbi:MAG: helicase associated domain-containing protein [Acidimicrobiales bacterium]